MDNVKALIDRWAVIRLRYINGRGAFSDVEDFVAELLAALAAPRPQPDEAAWLIETDINSVLYY